MSVSGAYKHYNRWPDFEKRWDAALKEGYLRLEMALLENAGRAFAAGRLSTRTCRSSR